jgi:hypothetical protein
MPRFAQYLDLRHDNFVNDDRNARRCAALCRLRAWAQIRRPSGHDLHLSEQAVLAAMTYVDLNPIRAEIATSVRGSKHTSVRQRAIQLAGQLEPSKQPLRPILGLASSHTPSLSQVEYIDLVDYTGRHIAPPALEKLELKPNHWVHRVKAFRPGVAGPWFRFVGELEGFAYKATELQKRALFGIGLARRLKKAYGREKQWRGAIAD